MLKGKSKAFKPKGPVRRPGGTAAASSSAAPSKAPTRETTQEPTNSVTSTANISSTAKRKDREDDTTLLPPAKRVATPPPSETNSTTIRRTSPVTSRQVSQPPRSVSPASSRQRSQVPLPTPPPTQPATTTASSQSQGETPITRPQPARSLELSPETEPIPSLSRNALPAESPAEALQQSSQPDSTPSETDQTSKSSTRKLKKVPARTTAATKRSVRVAASTGAASTAANESSDSAHPTAPTSLPEPHTLSTSSTVNITNQPIPETNLRSAHTEQNDQVAAGNPGPVGASLGPVGGDPGTTSSPLQIRSVAPVLQSAVALGGAGDVGDLQAGEGQEGSQLVPMAALNPDGTSGGIIEAPKTKTKKKTVIRKKKKAAAQTGGDGTPIDVDAQPKRGRPKKVRQPKPRKERSPTPSDAEEQMVDTSTLTMTELCKDLRIGKKFSRHDDIKQREVVKKVAQQAQTGAEVDVLLDGLFPVDGAAQPVVEGGGQSENNVQPAAPATAPAPQPQREASPEPIRQGGQAVMMRIVDGQIVIDERSIQVDRHRLAEQDVLPQDIVEENDFTRVITSGTYMKREKNQRWDWSSIEQFYNGLKSFGTDFGLIANMFPGRTRKQIKLLFNREERCNPELIKRTLAGQPIPVNFEEYSAMSGKTFVEISEIVAESKALDDQHKAELAEIESRKNAANKKKKDAIHGRNVARDILDAISDDEDEATRDGGAGEKENRAPSSLGGPGSRSREASTVAGGAGRKGKKGKVNKANKHSMRAGGDVVEVVGSLE